MTEVKTQAISAFGFKVEIAPDSTGSPGAYTEVGEMQDDDLDIPEDSAVAIRFRTNQSPGGYEETVMSKAKSLAEVTLSMNLVPSITIQSTLQGYFQNRTLCWVKVTAQDSSFVTIFKAYITKRKFEMKGANVYRAMLTFTPTGAPQTGSTFLGA